VTINSQSTLNQELNRLANGGTYRPASEMVDAALAARQWADALSVTTYHTDVVGVLNDIAKDSDPYAPTLDYSGICNFLAGTSGLPAAAALRGIAS
jgi:hypothetical protein